METLEPLEHPNLTQHEKKIVSETCGRLSAQLMREGVPEPRWAFVVLAVTVELAGQVLRLAELRDTERAPADPDPVYCRIEETPSGWNPK